MGTHSSSIIYYYSPDARDPMKLLFQHDISAGVEFERQTMNSSATWYDLASQGKCGDSNYIHYLRFNFGEKSEFFLFALLNLCESLEIGNVFIWNKEQIVNNSINIVDDMWLGYRILWIGKILQHWHRFGALKSQRSLSSLEL